MKDAQLGLINIKGPIVSGNVPMGIKQTAIEEYVHLIFN